TGIPRDDAIGRTTLDLDLWADLDDRRRMMEALQRDGRVHELAADFNRVGRGGIRHGLLWGELIQIQNTTCLLTVVRDVTDARQRQRERAEWIDELERKNQELERFAYTVAHDLRNPLVSIRGFVDLARDDWHRGDLAELPDHLLRISGGAERLQDLLDSLLELSRAGQVIESPRPVALQDVVDEALDALSSAVRGSGATITIEDDLPTVCADPTRLLQVMQNLLDNALGCLGNQPQPQVTIGTRDGGESAITTCYVRDNGHGIADDQLESIFRLFERGTTPSEGTGIGLALVRQIIESHGGEVWAESDGLGHGATFCFTLPTPPAC
ncbi:MAG: ATP-binding protein, partial [Acidobacteriota bacterium]